MIYRLLFYTLLLSLFSCINSTKNSEGEVLNSYEEEKVNSDSVKFVNRAALFSFLDDPDLNIQNFRNGLLEESLYFGESWQDIKPFAIPKNTEVGCYAVKYDRYKEFVEHPDAKINASLLAQVYVYRPTAKNLWKIGDSTEVVYSFLIARSDINLSPLPKIGLKKESLINQLGNPDINNDSVLIYYEEKEIYILNLDFYFKSDTLIKLEFKKLK